MVRVWDSGDVGVQILIDTRNLLGDLKSVTQLIYPRIFVRIGWSHAHHLDMADLRRGRM